jgi:hypothetical protein
MAYISNNRIVILLLISAVDLAMDTLDLMKSKGTLLLILTVDPGMDGVGDSVASGSRRCDIMARTRVQ